jgi:hypothetical protein
MYLDSRHRAPDDHPWKPRPDVILERTRAYHRNNLRLLPENAARLNVRIQPDFRDDVRWLQEHFGWTITEVLEEAVAFYRKHNDPSHPFALASASETPALPPPSPIEEDDADWRFLDSDEF